MRINKILSQHRRDFIAEYECEYCGHHYQDSGYDDTNFHANVVPKMTCEKCGKQADHTYRALSTKYPDDQVV